MKTLWIFKRVTKCPNALFLKSLLIKQYILDTFLSDIVHEHFYNQIMT